MKRSYVIGGVTALALAGAVGLAVAQDDPILLPPPEELLKGEAPPPAPAETPASVPPAIEPKTETKIIPAPPPPVAKAPEVVAPAKRPRYPIAILQAMDKVTAESIRFEARIDRPVQYKSLIFTVRACEGTAEDEPTRGAMANIEVQMQPPTPPKSRQKPALRQVFRGWMFAASPSLTPLEHPVYDAWLIACKAPAPLNPPPAAPNLAPLVKAPAPKVSAPKAKEPYARVPESNPAAPASPADAPPESASDSNTL
jgi:hypothetical protein